MKKLFAVSLLLSLSACSSQMPLPVSRANLQAQSVAQPAPQARILESFKGYLNHSQYDNSGMAEMLMTAKSLLGSTYDNRNSAARYYLYFGSSESLDSVGTIRLGRDKGLYFEASGSNLAEKVYYRLGSFQLAAGSKDGQDVSFTLDKNVSLKMKWRGINPMNHDELHLTIAMPMPSPAVMEKAAFF